MYSIAEYGKMIADRARTDAYAQALRETVRPGAVIVDIGCGSGILSLLACQCGARRVYAIEAADVIEVARTLAKANGYGDRIVFFADRSTRVSLPERADVIVSDLRGSVPLWGDHIPAVIDARVRFLASGGRQIPQCDTLWVSMVEAADLYEELLRPWEGGHGVNFEPAKRMALNYFSKGRVTSAQLAEEPKCWAILDYTRVESPNAQGQASWTIRQARTVHGWLMWFDAELTDSIRFSNAPSEPTTVYARAFMPWPQPMALADGDRVSVAIEARMSGENYLWRWETHVLDHAGLRKARFEQCNLSGEALSPGELRRSAGESVPVLGEAGRVDRFILSQMDGKTSQGEIAHRVVAAFSAQFSRWEDALTRVGELSQNYSR